MSESSSRSAASAVADPVTAEQAAPVVAPTGARGRAGTWIALGTMALLMTVDQLTKWWAMVALADGPIDLFWTVRLRLVRNIGSAFSFAEGHGPLLSLVAVAVTVFLLATAHAQRTRLAQVTYGLIAGGALGNVLDRLFREGDGFLKAGVVDFVDLQWWPVFNVADAAICVGAALLFVDSWREVPAPGRDRAPAA